MTNLRIVIPARRLSEIIAFTHDGIAYTGQISFTEDFRPIEVFLNGGKSGTSVNNLARDTGILASLALQFGTPVARLMASLTRNDDGSPAGPLGALLDTYCKGNG